MKVINLHQEESEINRSLAVENNRHAQQKI